MFYSPEGRVTRRYREDGSLDGSFTPQPAPPSRAEAIEEDGKILIAGPTEQSKGERDRLERLNADRTPDKAFGTNGLSDPVPFAIRSIAMLPTGEVLAAGNEVYGYEPGRTDAVIELRQVSVARFTAEGKLDTTYGIEGITKLHTAFGIGGGVIRAMVARPDGGALLGLASSGGEEERPSMLVSLTPSGGLENSFGESGKARVNQSILDVHLTADGAVLVAGQTLGAGLPYYQNAYKSDLLLARYTTTGQLDPSFSGGSGVAVASFGGVDLAHAVVWGSDGSALIGGSATAGTPDCIHFSFCIEEPILASFAPNGTLDPSFGTGGMLRLQSLAGPGSLNGDGILDLTARPVDGVLAAGSSGTLAFIAAITPGGALDPSFGQSGTITEKIPTYSSYQVGAIASDGHGRLLAAGESSAGNIEFVPGGVLARYTPDGQLDPTFGGGKGYIHLPIDLGKAISLASQGGIFVLSGDYRSPPAITKVTENGEIDTSFGEDGTVIPRDKGGIETGPKSIAPLPGGGVLMAGTNSNEVGSVARLGPKGQLDRSFGERGTVKLGFGKGSSCGVRQVIVQPNGRILLAGCVGQDMALVRLLPNGALDKSFGHHGLVIPPVGKQAEATAVAIHGGQILLTGWVRRAGKASYVLLRCTQAGQLERRFAKAGVAKVEVPGKHIDGTETAEILPTRRHIVVVRDGTGQPVLRFAQSGRFEPSFASGPAIAPGRSPATKFFPPGPFGTLQGNKPVLAWTTTLSPGLAVDLQRLRAG